MWLIRAIPRWDYMIAPRLSVCSYVWLMVQLVIGSWHDIVGKYSHEILVTSYRLLYMLPVTWSWLEMMSLFLAVYKEWQIYSRLVFGKYQDGQKAAISTIFHRCFVLLPVTAYHMHKLCNEIVHKVGCM
jgi:hypothetical protein